MQPVAGAVRSLDVGVGPVDVLAVDMRDMHQSIDKKFDSLIGKFDELHWELRGLMRFMIGMVISFLATLVGFGVAILGVMAGGFHWLG